MGFYGVLLGLMEFYVEVLWSSIGFYRRILYEVLWSFV